MADPFKTGLDHLRAGRWFEAHEELELAWRAAAAEERDFYQGLVHVAVAWYQDARGNRVGTQRQLEKALRRLAPYAPVHRGVAVGALCAQLRVLRETLDLRGRQPDGIERPVDGDVQPPVAMEEEE